MNENINLCEILKGHEGETFYSSTFGYITLIKINSNTEYPITVQYHYSGVRESYTKEGKVTPCPNSECTLFPSKDQRDWNKWLEEQKHKVPKTWSELVKAKQADIYTVQCNAFVYKNNPDIVKSALALLKIHQLIEVGYGGNVSRKELKTPIEKYLIIYNGRNLVVNCYLYGFFHIAFHTKEQAEEFLKYPENVQLLKDYFMIP